jgi:hypothetical protein
MLAKGADLDVHVGTQGQPLQNLVKLSRIVDFEYADVRPTTGDAPQMKPLASALKLGGTLVFSFVQFLYFIAVDIRRDVNCYSHMKQHGFTLFSRVMRKRAVTSAAAHRPFEEPSRSALGDGDLASHRMK